jgi:hypothetical protein
VRRQLPQRLAQPRELFGRADPLLVDHNFGREPPGEAEHAHAADGRARRVVRLEPFVASFVLIEPRAAKSEPADWRAGRLAVQRAGAPQLAKLDPARNSVSASWSRAASSAPRSTTWERFGRERCGDGGRGAIPGHVKSLLRGYAEQQVELESFARSIVRMNQLVDSLTQIARLRSRVAGMAEMSRHCASVYETWTQ